MDEENNNSKRDLNQEYNYNNEEPENPEINEHPATGHRGKIDIKMQKRTVTFGQSIPELGNNKIRTSKYTLLSFFPLNLFEQLTKTANIYFLVTK